MIVYLLCLKHILLLIDIELYNNLNLTTQILGKHLQIDLFLLQMMTITTTTLTLLKLTRGD